MSLEQEKKLEAQYVMPTFARKQVELVEGKGMYVTDSTGKTYLDFIAGIGVVSLGHCHPAVVEAISGQAARLMHVGNYYYIENRGEVARMISALLGEGGKDSPQNSWKSFFANSGAEANECAIKLARKYAKEQGRNAQTIITLQRSFHGRTLATLSATGQPSKQEAFKPLPEGFVHTPINDTEALIKLFEQQGDTICAVMLECIQGESGIHVCDEAFIKTAERLAHEHGALFICDEIQTGIYRTGKAPFAFQHYGVHPDIVTIAKGVASGFPVGVCAATTHVASAFSPGDHGTTFGGSSLAIAAIKATLDTLATTDITAQVEKTGEYLRTQLKALSYVVEVRGKGLMCACDIKDGLNAPAMVDEALQCGVLINATGPQTLRFLPPLICTEAEVDTLIECLATM